MSKRMPQKLSAILQMEDMLQKSRYLVRKIIVFGQSIFDYHSILPENSDPTLTPTQAFRIRCAQKRLIFCIRKRTYF